MSFSSNNSLSADIASDTSGNIFSSKLRRLKIQENVLAANVNKCFILNSDENDGQDKYQNDIKLKKYFTKLKAKFREVKHLFEEITLKTNDPESFENTGDFFNFPCYNNTIFIIILIDLQVDLF